jgi:hypothetical protein
MSQYSGAAGHAAAGSGAFGAMLPCADPACRARRRQLLERWRAVVAAALAAGRKSACKLEVSARAGSLGTCCLRAHLRGGSALL